MGNKYKKNYLSQVIARIDFLNIVPSLNESMPAKLSTASKKYFPIPEPKELPFHEVHIVGQVPAHIEQKESIREWHFWGKEREKHLFISQFAMFIEFTRYTTFGDFNEHFVSIIDGLFESYNDLQVKRLGLRYINNIEMAGKNRFAWNAYLNRNLLSAFNVPNDKNRIARAFNNIELNLGDCILRFQYGMHNPDYPAPIKKKVFTLDFDAYTVGLLTKDEIIQSLPTLHDEIESMFENSITDKLRGIMDVS